MQVKITSVAAIGLGTAFGFLLVSVGATTFDVMANMFLFENFQLPIVLAMAMMTGVVGVWMIQRMNATSIISQEAIEYHKIKFSPRLIVGALFFGVGWALTASCPGTAVAMLGEGKLVGLPVVLGILVGTGIFGLYSNRSQSS